MSAHPPDSLREFHRFVGEVVAKGGDALSPEEVLDEWRRLHPGPAEVEEETAAIAEAIADLDAGEVGIPFEEFDRDFRASHGFTPPS